LTTTLDALRAAEILSPLDEHFARSVGRIAGEARSEVLLAAALVSRHVGNGHVCLDLTRLVEGAALVDDTGARLSLHAWPALDAWRAMLQSSPLIGGPGDVTPLVLDDAGRLYLRRYWTHQAQLAAAIQARTVRLDAALDRVWLTVTLDRLWPVDPSSAHDPDWQRMAGLLAVQRRFLVISGGPGTGKTFTVVKILALLIEDALHRGQRLPRITLVAPTGKAAARLAESIRRTKPTLPSAEAIKAAIPDDAATIHRCLGALDRSTTRFRHNADNPLVTDVLLVDEASMVDLALMARLLDAVPLDARVLLLGDEDQLASVEAGAVLGDICNSGAPRSYSRAFVELIAALTGERLAVAADAQEKLGPGSLAPNASLNNQSSPSGRGKGEGIEYSSTTGSELRPPRVDGTERSRDHHLTPSPDLSLRERNLMPQLDAQSLPESTGIWDCIVQLTRSYRYGADSGIGALARAINKGDSDAALSILDSFDHPDVTLVAPTTDGRLSAALHAAVLRGFGPYLHEGDPAERLRAFERFRVLCAHRRGWDGVEWVNRQIEAALAAAGMIADDGNLYVGQPIIVTRNDYQLGLFNGDVGLIVRDPERADARVAFFIASDGRPRTLSPARLPPHETVFAMSVHKSQGSEFDEVAVLLPQQISPVVSRELLYTAVTRARCKVTIHASREVVAHAITHRIERASGLRELLWR